MKEYWIDFSGYVTVEAENANEAERKFWDAVHNKCPFLGRNGFSNNVWDIVDVTEEDVSIIDNPNTPNLRELVDFWNDK
jgi:hypothetical protein